ncbi:MAG TPA: permease-like cell division protein FtsX [Bacteroidia bacterium]|nr:permease-like cell division protein FtsX [Bacteroidia bacterium]
MAQPLRNRLRSSSITTVVSISLVLFILGLLALLILDWQKITRTVKEQANVLLFLNNNVRDADAAKLQKTLDVSPYVRNTAFISKDSAAKQLRSVNKEDFESLLGYNPLPASVNVHLKAEYLNNDSLKWIEKKFASYPEVKEVIYQSSFIDGMNRNIKKVTLIMAGFGLLLLLVALALINNTIRLTIYSKRFIIKTMQLVGATQGFIRKPFLWVGVRNGLYAALIAICMILATIRAAESEMEGFELTKLHNMSAYLIIAGMMLFLGIFISALSTFFALRRYLRLHADDLYYH